MRKTLTRNCAKDNLLSVLLILTLTLLNFSCAGCSDSDPDATGTIYIDPSLDTYAAGSGEGTLKNPFKYWSEVTFRPGYTYAQKKGTIAREEIIIDASGTAESPIILGAYGTGDAPVIQGSEIETGWTHESGSIYSKTLHSSCKPGMAAEDGTVLKFIAWNTDPAGTFTGASAGSFSVDYNNNRIYVWCTSGSPADHRMEVSRRYRCIIAEGVSYITIQDMHVRYASLIGIDIGACGITGGDCGSGASCSNITVKNCTVTGCGGLWFGAPYSLHLGNGIQFANGALNCRVEDCTVSDIFDSGVTPQVYTDGQSQSDITIINTSIARCGFAGVEIAGLNNLGSTGSISNVTMERVTVSGSGKGWSGDRSDEYPEAQGVGIKIAADAGSELSNIKIEQSSVTDCKGHAVWIYGNTGTVIVNRSKIFSNNGNGIAAMDNRADLSLKLVVTSSLIYNNGGNGILYYVLSGQGYTIYNNTFYGNSKIALAVQDSIGTALVKNNIFSTPGEAHLFCQNPAAGTEYNYNCYYGTGSAGFIAYGSPVATYADLAAFRSGTTNEDNGLEFNPAFTDAVNGNYTLQGGSQCIGRGDPGVNAALDFSGKAFKSTPSIGAYEY